MKSETTQDLNLESFQMTAHRQSHLGVSALCPADDGDDALLQFRHPYQPTVITVRPVVEVVAVVALVVHLAPTGDGQVQSGATRQEELECWLIEHWNIVVLK